MKTINEIIENKTISLKGYDKEIIEALSNLNNYHINECCCSCDCTCSEPCCCGTPQPFIFFYSEDEIINKLKTDVKVQDIFNLHNQFGDRFRFIAPGKEMDNVYQPLYFKESICQQGNLEEAAVLFTNVKFYTFIQKLVKQFKFTYPTVLSKCDGTIQLFFIMGGGSNGEECSIKSSLIKAVQVLNGLEAIKEIDWAQILDVSIDNLDDIYNFVVTCTISGDMFNEKSIKDFIDETY